MFGLPKVSIGLEKASTVLQDEMSGPRYLQAVFQV